MKEGYLINRECLVKLNSIYKNNLGHTYTEKYHCLSEVQI